MTQQVPAFSSATEALAVVRSAMSYGRTIARWTDKFPEDGRAARSEQRDDHRAGLRWEPVDQPDSRRG